jgi:hypothetical protein
MTPIRMPAAASSSQIPKADCVDWLTRIALKTSMGDELQLRPGEEVTVEPFCDYHQAICADEFDTKGSADARDEQSSNDGLALWDDGFAVGTARGWATIPLTFALYDDRPELNLDDWDHVVEGGVRLRSGRLVVEGPADLHDDAPRIILPPGDYSLLVLVSNLRSVDRESRAMMGDDRYRVVLWPGPVLSRRVLRRGLRRN